MLNLIWIGLFAPLIGFLTILVSSDKIPRWLAGWVACSAMFVSFLCFATLLWTYTEADPNTPTTVFLFHWLPIQGIDADVSLRLDPLSLVMTMIITGVGFLIHVYSNGYMEHDEDYARYFACLNLFVFAMLLLVLAENLLLLFVGWEGVGLASYLLIGFDYHRPAAAQAATKAFVVNRIGDLGLLLGLLLTFHLFGTSDIVQLNQRAPQEYPVGAPIITLVTILYFIGACGKSAQLPLHVWLPDAMEGPTPVSALIHAATMVTAGVYLVVRMNPMFTLAPATLQVVGAIGGFTALFAAFCALGQRDLKRVLAYSTVSQLGLMFLACGVGAFYAAIFHLTTHAFMKGLLFLSAGNVVHMMHGTTDMAKMGGLWRQFPRTHILFLIGVLAMSGIPPMAAFFSKDLILEQEHTTGHDVLYVMATFASILTAFYLTRAYILTFTGENRLDSKILKSVHEAPNIMLIPVSMLALLTILGGFLGFAIDKPPLLENFLAEIDIGLAGHAISKGFHLSSETWISIFGGLLGVGAAAYLYSHFPERIQAPVSFLWRSFYIDELYSTVIVAPLKKVSSVIANVFEPKVFGGMITSAANVTQRLSVWMQQGQSGQIRTYVAWITLGAVLLIVYFIV